MKNRRLVLLAAGILVLLALGSLIDYQLRPARPRADLPSAPTPPQDQPAAAQNTTLVNNQINQNVAIDARRTQTTITQHVTFVQAASEPVNNDRPVESRVEAQPVVVTPPPVVLLAPASPTGALPWSGPVTLLKSIPGGKVRLEGTANAIHTTWWVECPVIAGLLMVGPGFPIEPGQVVTPGKVQAQATNVFIRVRSLKSVEADGKPYSDRMNEVMYEHLKEDKYSLIQFRLTDLEFKEVGKSQDAPYLFDVQGELTVGGVTREVSFPVNVLPLKGKRLQVTGSTTLKMSDFKVGPVQLTILGIGLKTGDEVKLSFDWRLAVGSST